MAATLQIVVKRGMKQCFSVVGKPRGGGMMYEMRRRNSKPSLLLTQVIFLTSHTIYPRLPEELAFDGAVS